MKKTFYLLLLCALFISTAVGCANVKAYEREYLADPIMLIDNEREEQAVREHFLGTREGSTGSFGVSGGGCGCN